MINFNFLRYIGIIGLFFTLSSFHYLNNEKNHLLTLEEQKQDYLLGSNDVISIKVYDNPELSGDFKILSNGSIVYPIIGSVEVSGLSTLEVQELLHQKLEKDYLYNPVVSVEVKVYKSQAIYILGNVKKSGVHYLKQPTRLFDLLSEADVLSTENGKFSNGNHVKVIRQLTNSDNSTDTTFIVSLNQFLNEGNDHINIFLKNKDIIYIPNAMMVHIIGEVKKPGSYKYEEEMTVLKAISLAGGRTNASSQKNIIVKRIINNKETKIKVKMSDLLQPDDILEIPLSVW